MALYQSMDICDTGKHHEEWMRSIRKTVWLRADKESDNVPSTDALRLHWRRSQWVLCMWNNSTQNHIQLVHGMFYTVNLPCENLFSALNDNGWSVQNDILEVRWANMTRVKETIDFVLSV